MVQGGSLSGSGKSRSVKSLRKDGRLRKGQIAAETIVAFVGIRRTSRRARVDAPAIMREAQASLPALMSSNYRAVGWRCIEGPTGGEVLPSSRYGYTRGAPSASMKLASVGDFYKMWERRQDGRRLRDQPFAPP